MSRKQIALHTTFAALAAVALASSPAARADGGPTAAPVLLLAAAGSPTAATAATAMGSLSATIAGLSAASMQSLPGFPLKAYRDGYRQGRVSLAYTVQPDGTVSQVQVLDATPVQVFTAQATSMVAGWRFVPTTAAQSRRVDIDFVAQ